MGAGEYIFSDIDLTEHLPSICPGRYLSDNSLFLMAACILAVYDIKPPVDDQGIAIKIEPEFTNGILS
jgi:hypothetical protein